MFHVRHLHLGHLAKAFALREAPSTVTGAGLQGKKKYGKAAPAKSSTAKTRRKGSRPGDNAEDYEVGDAEKRMEQVVRAQGRLTKKGGKMVRSGTGEFQIAGGYDLEKLVTVTRL